MSAFDPNFAQAAPKSPALAALDAPVLRAVDVWKSYPAAGDEPPLDILRGASLEARPGDATAVMGRSGCGKSTFVGLLAGLDSPSKGRVEIMGRSWSDIPPRELNGFRARNVGVVFQQFHLLEHLTALENARLPFDLSGEAGDERARALLERVGLGHRLSHFPAQMSRGEQQRCAIARTLAMRPRLVLADEPTGSLDARTGREVIDLVFRLAEQENVALIVVTHDASVAARCSRRLWLDQGTLSEAPPAGFA